MGRYSGEFESEICTHMNQINPHAGQDSTLRIPRISNLQRLLQ